MPAPPAEAVEELRAAGHALNRLLPAMSTASTDAQRGRDRGADRRPRWTALLPRRPGVRLTAPPAGAGAAWLLVGMGGGWCGSLSSRPPSQVWSMAARAAGFRSVANWVRDALAGLYGLAVARPPAPVTIDARAVAGRVLGLVAQTETAVADWPPAECSIGASRRPATRCMRRWSR